MPDSDTKVCTYCGEYLAIDQFRRKSKTSDVRHSQCNDCHRKDRRERRRLARAGKAIRYATEVVAAERNRNKVIALTAGVVQELGSITGVVRSYKDAIDASKEAGRHYTMFRLLKCTMDLIVVAGDLNKERLNDMADDEIQERVIRQTMALLEEHPMLAITAANRLPGWQVIPPNGVDAAT